MGAISTSKPGRPAFDPYIGRMDSQADSGGFFVKARLPQMPGASDEKYLMCHVDGWKVGYKELSPEEIEVNLHADVGEIRLLRQESSKHFPEELFGKDSLHYVTSAEYLFSLVDLDGDGRIELSELAGACSDSIVRQALMHIFPDMS